MKFEVYEVQRRRRKERHGRMNFCTAETRVGTGGDEKSWKMGPREHSLPPPLLPPFSALTHVVLRIGVGGCPFRLGRGTLWLVFCRRFVLGHAESRRRSAKQGASFGCTTNFCGTHFVLKSDDGSIAWYNMLLLKTPNCTRQY